MQRVVNKEVETSRKPIMKYAKKSISYLKKKAKMGVFPGIFTAMTLAACSPAINPPVSNNLIQPTMDTSGNITNTKFIHSFPQKSHLFQAFVIKNEPVNTISYKIRASDDNQLRGSGILFSAVELNGIVNKKWYQMGLFRIPRDMKITGKDIDEKEHVFAMGYQVWDKAVSIAPCSPTACQMGFIPTKIRKGDEVVLKLSIADKKVKMSIHDLTTGERIEGELPADGNHFDGGYNEYNNATGLLMEIASLDKLGILPPASYQDLTNYKDDKTVHVTDEFTITLSDTPRAIIGKTGVYDFLLTDLSIPDLSITTRKRITRIKEIGTDLTYKPIPEDYLKKALAGTQDSK